MTIATQEVFFHTSAKTVTLGFGAATPARTVVRYGAGVAVTLTDTEGVTKPAHTLFGDVKITGITRPGVGGDKVTSTGKDFNAGAATDGTWEVPVTGALLTTPQGATVYYDASDDALTLTSDTDTVIAGYVNYPGTYKKVAGILPVKIGA